MTELLHADDGVRHVSAASAGGDIQIIIRVPFDEAVLRSMTRGQQPAPLCYATHLANRIKHGGVA